MRSFEKYCKDYENIENYEKAAANDFKGWHCHHRLETHTSDGERRLVDISMDELKALDMYFDRPALELIFLTSSEHSSSRKVSDVTREKQSKAKKGKLLSEEHKKKISEGLKGNKNTLGKRLSDEAKKKISDSLKRKPLSEEHKRKLAETKKGEKNPMYGKHPWNRGKPHSEESKQKMRESHKGKHIGNKASKGMRWFNNGIENKLCYEQPDGYEPGMLKRK